MVFAIRRLICPVWLATLLLVLPAPVCGADPTLEDMADALQQWKDSWVTLRVEWERRNPVQLRRYASDPEILNAESLDDYFHREKWIFAGDGLDRFEVDLVEAGESVILHFQVHNAGKSLYFDGDYKRKADGTEFLTKLHLNTWNPTTADRSDPKNVYAPAFSAFPVGPFYNQRQKEWIGETLARGGGTLEGFEEIDGVRCARVRLGEFDLWLDSQHDFLPRKLESVAGAKGLVVGTVWTADEFQRLENAIWFPMRGTFWQKNDPADEVDRWIVTEVAVSETLDPKLFEPPKPDVGTWVEDRRTGKMYTQGQRQQNRNEREQALVEEARKNAPEPVDDPITAEIPLWDRYAWSVVLLALAGLVLGAGFWLSRRK